MHKYTIYLGLQNPETKIEYCEIEVIEYLKTLFHYATIIHSQGLYIGGLETTLIIELIDNIDNKYKVKHFCKKLKQKYNQECVMLTTQKLDNVIFI